MQHEVYMNEINIQNVINTIVFLIESVLECHRIGKHWRSYSSQGFPTRSIDNTCTIPIRMPLSNVLCKFML